MSAAEKPGRKASTCVESVAARRHASGQAMHPVPLAAHAAATGGTSQEQQRHPLGSGTQSHRRARWDGERRGSLLLDGRRRRRRGCDAARLSGRGGDGGTRPDDGRGHFLRLGRWHPALALQRARVGRSGRLHAAAAAGAPAGSGPAAGLGQISNRASSKGGLSVRRRCCTAGGVIIVEGPKRTSRRVNRGAAGQRHIHHAIHKWAETRGAARAKRGTCSATRGTGVAGPFYACR